jgi:hypothetical protein
MNPRGCISPALIGLMLGSNRLSREAAAAEGRELRGGFHALDSRRRVQLDTYEMTTSGRAE